MNPETELLKIQSWIWAEKRIECGSASTALPESIWTVRVLKEAANLEEDGAAGEDPELAQAEVVLPQILPVQEQDLIVGCHLEHLHDLKMMGNSWQALKSTCV